MFMIKRVHVIVRTFIVFQFKNTGSGVRLPWLEVQLYFLPALGIWASYLTVYNCPHL